MLPPTEFIEGLFSLLYVIFSVLVGLLITSNYLRYKDKTFIFIGIAVGGIAVTHWTSSISFLTNVIFNKPLPAEIFLLIATAFTAPFIYLWIFGINNLLFDKINKKFLILFAVLLGAMETVLLVLFFLNPSNVGTVTPPYNLNAEMTGIIILFSIIELLSLLITGFWASLRSMKSTTALIKLKGRVLFCTFLLWFIAISLDINFPLDALGIVIIRTLLIISVIGLYLGFVMPEIVQKFFIKIKLLKLE